MNVNLKKRIIPFLLLFVIFTNGTSQEEAHNSLVQLLSWSATACDNIFDTDRLVNRISAIKSYGDTTLLTASFSDNCCAAFKPTIAFDGKRLDLFSYQEYIGDYCACRCCFSIQFEVIGLSEKEYDIFFNKEKVEISADHYATVTPSFEIYQNQKINKVNKYGLREGLWITFYENGAKKEIRQYPERCDYYPLNPLWSQEYFLSGQLSAYSRKDTTETWFDDGVLKSQSIKYQAGDTTYTKAFSLFDNRQLREKYLERDFPTVFKSEFYPAFEREGSRGEVVYKEAYYEDGQPKFLYGQDTSYSWYETGQLKMKTYDLGSTFFNEEGKIVKKNYYWKERGTEHSGDLKQTLYLTFYSNGMIEEIHLVRDEIVEETQFLAPTVHYYWTWDREGQLTSSPKKWNEVLPWKQYPDIQFPLLILKKD